MGLKVLLIPLGAALLNDEILLNAPLIVQLWTFNPDTLKWQN